MDAKAIFTTVAVMVFANGAVLATVYRDLPATLRPAAARWQAGTVLVAAGCAIFAFGSFLPMPIMVALANFVLTTGLTIYHRALRNFYGRPAETWDMALPFVATASVYWWSAIEPSFIIRLGVISLMWLWLMGRSLHLLHAMRHVDTSRSRSMLMVIHAMVMSFVAARFIIYLSLDLPRGFSLTTNDNPLNLITPIIMAALPAIGTTAFVLLCSDRMRRQLEITAATDDLTGLANRRTLIAHGKARFRSHEAKRQGLAIAVLDLDAFKSINDSHGHEAGDQALVHVAECLRQAARKLDLVARSGGEEFVVIMEDLDGDEAGAAVERMRCAVEAELFRAGTVLVPITVSAGVAVALPGDKSFDDILRRADNALYQAKANGRNCVMLAA